MPEADYVQYAEAGGIHRQTVLYIIFLEGATFPFSELARGEKPITPISHPI